MTWCSDEADMELFMEGFQRTESRGPDDMRVIETGKGIMGFQRLSIMGLTEAGMQPFSRGNRRVVCNGEIYGFRRIKEELIKKGLGVMTYSQYPYVEAFINEKQRS